MTGTKRYCVIGGGRIGLPISVRLCEEGSEVIVLEKDRERVSMINGGLAPFHEEGMEEGLRLSLGKGLISATYDSDAIAKCNVIISAIGTGISDDGVPEIESIKSLVDLLSPNLKKGDLVILKTTLPIGTTEEIASLLSDSSRLVLEEELFVAFSPERIVEGKAMQELRTLPKIVGGVGQKSTELASEVMSVLGGRIIQVSDSKTAEMCKLMDNAYRMTRFGFSSDVALVSSINGVDAFEAIRAANLDYPRNSIPLPSVGVSGYCLSKDPYYLEASGRGIWEERGFHSTWVNARISADYQLRVAIDALRSKLGSFDGATVVVGGLTYKENVDDTRDSHGMDIAERLSAENAIVRVWEPNIKSAVDVPFENFDSHDSLIGADALIITVPHDQFIEWSKYPEGVSKMKRKIIFDGWGIIGEGFPEDAIVMGTGRYIPGMNSW